MTAMTLSRALALQTQEFPSWEEMSEVEQLHSIWWDAYKDAYGFRPRGVEVGHWTAEFFRSDLEFLGKEIDRRLEEERQQELHCIEKFEELVAKTIATGAQNRETALRWIMDACPAARGDDWDFLCYEHGLPYGYFRKAA